MFRTSNLALALCLGTAAMQICPMTDAFSISPLRSNGQIQRYHTNSPPPFGALLTTSTECCLSQKGSSSALFMAAKSILVRKPESSVELTITAPGSATKAAYNEACAEAAKSISIPGFRKGATMPPAVVENAVSLKGGATALRTQAIQQLINLLLEPALKDEHNLEPIGQPSLVTPAEELAASFEPGEPIDLVLRCDVWPDIEWEKTEGGDGDAAKTYVGLKGTYERKPFNQARFDKSLSDLCERYATKSAAEEGRALAMEDVCIVNMVGYLAASDDEDDLTKGEPLPNSASGDEVEIIMGTGRYMEGLVEGLVGAKKDEKKTVAVSFPTKLKDKFLAGRRAIFEVTVNEVFYRSVPELDDTLANEIRPESDAETIKKELRKAVDDQEAGEWTQARNKALSQALSKKLDVEVPDTLVVNQAREKYAQMMTDFRSQGMDDGEIKKLITPENFEKYKEIQKKDIVNDFKVSMAIDEIARLENIEVASYEVDEQIANLKKENADEDMGDEAKLRAKVEQTIQRKMVFDYLDSVADLSVTYKDENEGFDADLMDTLAKESLDREEGKLSSDGVVDAEVIASEKETPQGKSEEELKLIEMETAKVKAEEEVKAATKETARIKAEDDAIRIKAEEVATIKAEDEARGAIEEAARRKAEDDVKAAEAKAAAEETARIIAEEEVRAATEKAAIIKAEEEAKAVAEEATRIKKKLEASRIKAEEEAKTAAEEAARIKAEVEAKAAADEAARVKAEVEAKAAADEAARVKAEVEAKAVAEEAARAKAAAEEAARVKAEEEAKAAVEVAARAKAAAEEAARVKAEEEAKAAVEEAARVKAEEEAKAAAEEAARLEAEERYRNSREGKAEARATAVAQARSQPKSAEEWATLAAQYGAMDLEERAYNILYDLGMFEETPDPDSPDYDNSVDDELA